MTSDDRVCLASVICSLANLLRQKQLPTEYWPSFLRLLIVDFWMSFKFKKLFFPSNTRFLRTMVKVIGSFFKEKKCNNREVKVISNTNLLTDAEAVCLGFVQSILIEFWLIIVFVSLQLTVPWLVKTWKVSFFLRFFFFHCSHLFWPANRDKTLINYYQT